MGTPTPPLVVEAFATSGGRNVIPVPSQISITPGAASFEDGFPPLTRTPLPAGIPPAGLDMNGILYMISAHTAWLQAGGQYVGSAPLAAAVGGYNIGAIVQSSADPNVFFMNTQAGNTNIPPGSTTGWIKYSPLSNALGVQTTVLAAGATNNLALGTGIGFLDLNPTSGASNVTGIVPGFDGQILGVSNIHASNPVTLNTLNGGSSAANRMRLPTDITLLQYSGVALRASYTLGLWVPLS